ncbi:unnamed protein product, partial [Rotaria sp. Silwood1]
DMNKPINVLTGIDCWLDNLMCNVPELAMCYHVDGIVQSYEIIKTEDIPYREGCQFPPSVIRDLATNLLSFLKANATKEGHTYWLFKEETTKLHFKVFSKNTCLLIFGAEISGQSVILSSRTRKSQKEMTVSVKS